MSATSELDADDLALLRQTFLAEAREQLEEMEASLLALERRPEDLTLVQPIFRVAHTIKGNGAMLGMSALADYTHHLEGLLDRARSGHCPVTAALVDLLLRALDDLEAMTLSDPAAEATAWQLATLERIRAFCADDAGAPFSSPDVAHRGEPAPNGGGRTLRIDVAKLDRMLDLVGEIAVARGRLSQLLESDAPESHALARAVHREYDRLQAEMQELVLKVRMVPVGPLFHRFARTVRDLSKDQGKEARLLVDGEGVELDTSVIEPLKDALSHVLRNAVDHGIELPHERRAAGKDPCGTIRLRAAHDSGSLLIEVADDGSGLKRSRILESAHAQGFLAPGAEPDDRQLASLVFAHGFTTAVEVTEVSGRGVGMDVVRRNIEMLRGALELSSRPGRGLTVTIRLPLTLAIIEGFVVTAGGGRFVIPMEAVVECLDASDRAGRTTEVLSFRGEALPCLGLRELLGIPGETPARQSVVVVRSGGQRAGLFVDELLGQAQLVLKPLSGFCRSAQDISGTAILGDGCVALVLDVGKLVRHAGRTGKEAVPCPT